MGANRPRAVTWRLAASLVTLRAQINAFAPNRSKLSDGSIGNEAHASRSSDHNPWVKDSTGLGVVTAIDVTHDPKRGCDSQRLADALVASRDARVKYIIFNRQIARAYDKPGIPAWSWAPYGGANAHTKHVHVSVIAEPVGYDSTVPWVLGAFLRGK